MAQFRACIMQRCYRSVLCGVRCGDRVRARGTYEAEDAGGTAVPAASRAATSSHCSWDRPMPSMRAQHLAQPRSRLRKGRRPVSRGSHDRTGTACLALVAIPAFHGLRHRSELCSGSCGDRGRARKAVAIAARRLRMPLVPSCRQRPMRATSRSMLLRPPDASE